MALEAAASPAAAIAPPAEPSAAASRPGSGGDRAARRCHPLDRRAVATHSSTVSSSSASSWTGEAEVRPRVLFAAESTPQTTTTTTTAAAGTAVTKAPHNHRPSLARQRRQAAVAADLLRALRFGGDGDDTDDDDDDDEPRLHDVVLLGSSPPSSPSKSSSCTPSSPPSTTDSRRGDDDGDGDGVPASRFVLAARSPVFRRMLYGNFREAQSAAVRLMDYTPAVLRAVVHYCEQHDLLVTPTAAASSMSSRWSDDDDSGDRSSSHSIGHFVQVAHAADFLQLPGLVALAEQRVRRHMAQYPATACAVLEAAAAHYDANSPLAAAALRLIEVRPYATLPAGDGNNNNGNNRRDCQGITALSPAKLELVLSNRATAASEWFLLQQLLRWHEHRQQQLQQQTDENGGDENDGDGDGPETPRLLAAVTRQLIHDHIGLVNVEPAHLLSPSVAPFVSRDMLFRAVSHQALRAARDTVWRLHYRGPSSNGSGGGGGSEDRVLVQKAGSRDANGMYYRIAVGLSRGSDLYAKREVSVGQPCVYTLSRRLVTTNSTLPQQLPQPQQHDEPQHLPPLEQHYECRIFCSQFLTHRAVRALQTMQLTATIVPCFQPVLQLLELTPPAEAASATASSVLLGHEAAVPTPIRRYYRVRLSDGDCHMPGTLAPDLNALVEQGDLGEHHVLQVLEFGLYTLYGTVGIHVMKAAVVTTAPSCVFADPVPLEDAPSPSSSPDRAPARGGDSDNVVQHLYATQCPASDGSSELCGRIPPTGWQVDHHGQAPAPECTWIPGTTTTTTAGAAAGAAATHSGSVDAAAGSSCRSGGGGSSVVSVRSSAHRSTSPRSVASAPAL